MKTAIVLLLMSICLNTLFCSHLLLSIYNFLKKNK